jgi:hypothetical protein
MAIFSPVGGLLIFRWTWCIGPQGRNEDTEDSSEMLVIAPRTTCCNDQEGLSQKMECWFIVINVWLPQLIWVQAIFQDPLLPGCLLEHSIGAHGMSRDSIAGVVTGYGLDSGGVRVRVPVGSVIFSSPSRPDRLWRPSNLLYNGYRGKVAVAWSWPLTSS